VLYVVTVHYQSSKWIDIQIRQLRRTITVPFRTFAVLNEIDPAFDDRFDTVISAKGPHEGKLNLMAAEIMAVGHPDDILLFLDGDAFPIADPMPAIEQALAGSSLVAVRRDENWGDRQPHPSFCAVRLSEWERLHGDWSRGSVWLNNSGHRVTDVGGNLLASLERSGSTWTPLLRTNVWNPHPLWFGIYGGIVYHHGAGFRDPRSRVDREASDSTFGQGLPVVGRVARSVNLRRKRRTVDRLVRQSVSLSDDWYTRIQADPDFYRALMVPGGGIDAQSGTTGAGGTGQGRR
jgi:hypothetical protein